VERRDLAEDSFLVLADRFCKTGPNPLLLGERADALGFRADLARLRLGARRLLDVLGQPLDLALRVRQLPFRSG
jgi:hypothetical protein